MAVADSTNKRMLLSGEWGSFLSRYSHAKFVPTALWCDLSKTEWLVRKLGQIFDMQPATWLVSRELTEAAGPWNTELAVDDDGEDFCRCCCKVTEPGLFREPGFTIAQPVQRVSVTLGGRMRNARPNFGQWSYTSAICAPCIARVRAACVRYFQNNAITFYPERKDIFEQAQRAARELGGEVDVPLLSWKYAWIEALFGWNLAKRVQVYAPRFKWSLFRLWDNSLFLPKSHSSRKLHHPHPQVSHYIRMKHAETPFQPC